MARTIVPTGDDFGDDYGYSRAVRVSDVVFVSGTTAAEDQLHGGTYDQATSALRIIAGALAEAGASMADVVRTTIYVVDLDDLDEVAHAHAEAFDSARPASTIAEVSRLTPSAARVEIEVTAVIGSSG